MTKGEIHSFIVHKGLDQCLIHNPAKCYNDKQAVNCVISKPGAAFTITHGRLKWYE